MICWSLQIQMQWSDSSTALSAETCFNQMESQLVRMLTSLDTSRTQYIDAIMWNLLVTCMWMFDYFLTKFFTKLSF